MDELPELLNILKGDMAIVGPRPQLVRDMVFMSGEQRKRHSIRPGLTGLAQVRGRDVLASNPRKKAEVDGEYVENITFWGDVKIFFQTIAKVFSRADVVEGKKVMEETGATETETSQTAEQPQSETDGVAAKETSELTRAQEGLETAAQEAADETAS